MLVEWDDNKNLTNIAKHGISFLLAAQIFKEPCFIYPSDRNNEHRFVAVGKYEDGIIAVIYTKRAGKIRIISARRARKNEKEKYYSLFN